MSTRKELNFFLRGDDGKLPGWVDEGAACLTPLTLADYEAVFAEAGPQHRAIGEASPSYLFAGVASRIKVTLPDAKLVAILRHPIGQATSILSVWLGREPTADELEQWLSDGKEGPKGTPPLAMHGRYADHLEPYFALYPRERIKIVLFEDFRSEPDVVIAELEQFLGVDHVPLPHLHLNASGPRRSQFLRRILCAKALARAAVPKPVLRRLTGAVHRIESLNTSEKSPNIAADFRAELTERFYGGNIRKLEELVEVDLDHWRRPSIPRVKTSDGHKSAARHAWLQASGTSA